MRVPRGITLPIAALVIALACPASESSASPREYSGEIDGALYHIVAPEGAWNGSLWIEAHGLRFEGSPLLASLSLGQEFNATMIERGWAIATTSYRRNGVIVDDAITDVRNLRAEIARQLGEPRLVIIEGSSMGGGIATLIAEQFPEGFSGIVAAGAAHQVVDPGASSLSLTHSPKIPIVYLTNQSELDGPAAYVATARESKAGNTVAPVLWKVLRDGHVNVSAAERLAALDAVVAWIESGVSPGDRDDATIDAGTRQSETIFHDDGTATARVADLSREYGNLFTAIQPPDMERLGIRKGDSFLLRTTRGEYRVVYGTTYTDVARGEWVAFPLADGRVMIARNFAHAADTAGLGSGDSFTIAPVK